MNPLLGQGDGTWSTRLGESGWPDPGNSDSTDGKDWQPTGAAAGAAAFTDLVPEFEPGKPWKVIHFQYRTSYVKKTFFSIKNLIQYFESIVYDASLRYY